MNFSDAEFMQYLRYAGFGPSVKNMPQMSPHSTQDTSSRLMPRLLSVDVRTFSLAIEAQNLGHLELSPARVCYISRPGGTESMVRPERFELPTFWFVARRSIQLS